jgi:Immunoglobulin I-set domain
MEEANLADDGNYTCIVSNEFGTISHTVTVDVVGECIEGRNLP